MKAEDSTPYIGIIQLLSFLALVAVKLLYFGDMSWWVVTSPIWAPMAVAVSALLIIALFGIAVIIGAFVFVLILDKVTK